MKNKMRKARVTVLLLLVFCATILSCTKKNEEVVSQNEGVVNQSEEKVNTIEDKVYHGIAEGYNDNIEVDVTMNGDTIKDVKVTKHNETPGIGGELRNKQGEILLNGGESPITLIPNTIVKNQSLNVDAVSGATATSWGVLHAVAGAMMKADYRLDAVSAATEEIRPDVDMPKVDFTDEEKALYDKWMTKANHDTEHTDKQTDVVVVGGGGAGLAAAIAASENGANVIIVEKKGEVGGNTLVCGAIYNAIDEELQDEIPMTEEKRKKIEEAIRKKPVNDLHSELIEKVREQLKDYDEEGRTDLFDSKEWFALQTYNGGDNIADLKLVETLCYNAYDGLKWIENIGVDFYGFISQGAGSLWERTHTNTMPMGTGFISSYLTKIKEDENIKILTNTEAISIKKDDTGKVIGVMCKDKYGNEFSIEASKGVVIATGGFSSNEEMLKKYGDDQGTWKGIKISELETTNRKTLSDGKGIEEGIEIGAGTVDLSEIQLLYLGNTKNGQLTKYPPRCVNGTDQIIFINKDGNRFVNEGGRRDDICRAILNEKENLFYIVESGDGDKYVDIYSDEFKSADGFSLDYLVKNEYIYVADTIEELADKIGVDVDNLKATIDDFNKCVDGKEDAFGRTLYSTKIEKGPYIATPRQVSVHHTMGGLKINENAQVLNEKDEPIKGLYAAGEATGGIHGGNRLGGNAVVDTVVYGKIAGENVAKE